jgi:hypothetical protein
MPHSDSRVAPPVARQDAAKDDSARGARVARIAAGAAIGSAAVAGALLFAGKVDGRMPKRVWDKVKPPSRKLRASLTRQTD